MHIEEGLAVDGQLYEPVLGILVGASEPRGMGHGGHAGCGSDLGLVRQGQRLAERYLVEHHQAIGARDLGAVREGAADRHQEAEKHERDEDGQ